MLVCSLKFRVILWLALFLGIQTNERVKVENGAYKDVVVSFSLRLPPENGTALVHFMEEILIETSAILQTALGLRIGSVTFHLPHTWNASEFDISSRQKLRISSNIRIESLNDSAFGQFPYASQYGGCGVPGREIIIPDEFLKPGENNHKGKLLAREWLKYQYGVFDENGFQNDVLYPSYFKIPGSAEWLITDCTSPKVEYTFRDSDDNNCTLNKDLKCFIYPEEGASENVTSSLMFFHEDLLSVNHVCRKDTHNKDSLNKQNLLCNYESVFDVIERSGDLSSTDESQEDHKIEFSYVQESKLRLVVAVETTQNLENKETLIIGAIRRLMHDVPLQSEFGVFDFLDSVSTVLEFSEFSPAIRDKKIDFNNKFKRPITPCLTCAVSTAVQNLTSTGKKDPGTIVIITASNPQTNASLVRELKASNLCLLVIGFSGALKEKWNNLMSASDCGSFWEVKDSEDKAEIFQNLYEAIGSVLPTPVDDTRNSIISTDMISQEFEVPVNPLAKSFTLWIFEDVKNEEIKCSTAEGSLNLIRETNTKYLVSFSFESQSLPVKCQVTLVESMLVQVQMTTKQGAYVQHAAWICNTDEDSEEQMPVIVYAQLFYGQYPIQNATVIANVTKRAQNSDDSGHSIELFDDGRGDPDITKNDGIYSRYFTEFESEGDYDVIITANDNKGQAKIGKSGESPCCGSRVISETAELDPFEVTFSTSFRAKSKKPDTGYKPSRITDLKVETLKLPESVTLTWTAPGGEMDQGQAQSYTIKSFISMEDPLQKFEDSKIGKLIEAPSPKSFGEFEMLEIKLEDFEDNSTHFFAMQARSDKNQTSSPSNIVMFFIPEGKKPIDEVTSEPPQNKESAMKPGTIGLIVGLTLLVILIIVCIYLFIYKMFLKPKRKKEDRGSQGRNSTDRHQYGPQIPNSIPADVIMKHHNEVVNAKKFYKSPPIFKEENIEMEKDQSNSSDNESQNKNVNYTLPDTRDQRTFQDDKPRSPKRMTVV